MFIVESYPLAIVFCFITMLCWGSWGNTQKLAQKSWRYELFYWDYVIGMVLAALLLGFTMGSTGDEGRGFIADLSQASAASIGWVLAGGVIFNASNILLSASTALAGMSVAFPLGVGLALVLGVIINYIGLPSGDPVLLFAGVALVVAAIVCNGIASGVHQRATGSAAKTNTKGLLLAAAAGILMSFFFRCVVKGMDVDNFAAPTAGMMTPYSAIFVFSLGVLASNFIFNTLVMRYPFTGERVRYAEYFRGSVKTHAVGMLGGAVWCIGSLASYIASGAAGTAISYGLGQGATMVAAFWGVFIWREFRGGSRRVNMLIALMFVLFLTGLGLIIKAGN